jgi:nifR3 family TIM-barrel protein
MGFYRPVTIGGISLPGNLFLAPVAGYTDRAFRSVCIEQGADYSSTELVSSEALTRNSSRTEALLLRAQNEGPLAIQLFGADPSRMGEAAGMLSEYSPSTVDINAGCPVPKVTKTGAGSALLREPERLGRIVEAVVKSARNSLGGAPVTVKLRSGWDDDSINYRECGRIAVEAGAAMVSLHPRTRAQGYGGRSKWLQIQDLASRLSVPVIGSGDLFSPEDAEAMLRETGCAGVMFARGALGNPFIFSAAKAFLEKGVYAWPSPQERFQAAFTQLRRLAAYAGEKAACLEMRKHFCAYSKAVKYSAQGVKKQAALRDKIVHAETIAEYRSLLLEAGIQVGC